MKTIESQDGSIKAVIPENLDLPSLINIHKPTFCFKVDRCMYILNQIADQFAYNKRLAESHDSFPYVPLSSSLLVRQVYNYDDYLQYLTQVGVLECDNLYKIGRKCKAYRYTDTYRTKPVTCQIVDFRLIKDDQKRVDIVNTPALSNYPELLHWYEGLQLNEAGAVAHIEEEYKKSARSKRKKTRERALTRCMARLAMVNRFVHNPPIYLIDSKAHRLHTKLTNFWKELRPFLTFRGNTLVAIDLSCSQPYLSTLLLQSFFYEGEKSGQFTIDQLPVDVQDRLYCKPSCIPNISASAVLCIPPTSHTHTPPHHLPPPQSPLMLGLLSKHEAYERELQLFKSSVETGKLYEVIGERFREQTGRVIAKRQHLKDIMFSILFSDNDATKEFFKFACSIFRQAFPMIYGVFRELKSRSNSDLAILLQAIEAEIFLNRIARRISQEYPSLPIFTVHDSIVTIDGYQGYIKEVMHDELCKATGICPNFKEEIWA